MVIPCLSLTCDSMAISDPPVNAKMVLRLLLILDTIKWNTTWKLANVAGPLILDLDGLPDDDLGPLAVALGLLHLVGVRAQHVAHDQHLRLRGRLADLALVVAGQTDEAPPSLHADYTVVRRLLPPDILNHSMLVNMGDDIFCLGNMTLKSNYKREIS